MASSAVLFTPRVCSPKTITEETIIHAACVWLAGGGIKPGITHGPSDEWGYKPADRHKPTEVYDVHATILHLLGIDHTRLTFRHTGIDRRLTDVHGEVIQEILS